MNSNRQEQEKRYLKIEQSVFQMKISCGSVIHRGQKRIRSMAGSDDVKCYIPLFGFTRLGVSESIPVQHHRGRRASHYEIEIIIYSSSINIYKGCYLSNLLKSIYSSLMSLSLILTIISLMNSMYDPSEELDF